MDDLEEAVIRHAERDMASDRTMAQPQGIAEPQQERTLLEAVSESKVVGELTAMWREGAKDLYNAVVPAFPESAHGVDEIGTPLSPTQYMINEDLKAYDAELDRAGSMASGREQERGLER